MPAVSVIIPTYNRGKFIIRAVESVLNQTFKDHEIIVIDDGSTDNTRSALQVHLSRINYIYQKNSGVSAARNAGIESATGEWVAFLDSDDEWTAGYLARQMKQTEEFPRVCMQTTNCSLIGLDGQTTSYFEINQSLAAFKGADYFFLNEPFRFVIEHGPWQVGSTIIRAAALKRAGLFDVSLTISEDLDLLARVALQGPLGLIRDALVNIFRRDEPIECLTNQAKEKPVQARESDERMYEKLGKIGTLGKDERKALNRVRSANRRAIGNLLLKSGKLKEARDCYKRAVLMDPSIRSLGKYALSLARVA